MIQEFYKKLKILTEHLVFVFIILSVLLFLWAGFIFWRDAYLVVNTQNEVNFQSIKIDEKGLQSVLDELKKRELKLKEIE